MSSVHYVISVSVKRIVHTDATKDYGQVVPARRDVVTIANLVVSAKNILELRNKIDSHVQLIDDSGSIET